MYKLLVAVALLAITGCAAPKAVNLRTSFNQSEASKLLEKGANTVKGSALIRQQGGGIVTCAGTTVELVPATQYAQERISAIYNSNDRGYNPIFGGVLIKFDNTDLGYVSSKRETVCDAQGFFKFDNISDGSFFVISIIVWGTDTYVKQGGRIMQRVTVSGGETKEIVVSP